ncbi:MAG: VOC family protein [Clostridia bacterium]|nr:VOC family protein [Deltaproteobacteria bacterium]
MTRAIHHLAVKTTDLVRAEHFYIQIVGLSLQKRHDDATGKPRAIWCELTSGFLAIEKSETAKAVKQDGDPGWHGVMFGIGVEERESMMAHFERHGHAVVKETDFTFYVRDPDGNMLGFSHYPTKR